MKRRLISGAVALIASLTLAGPAFGYQHLANTETQCYRDTNADAYANLGFINNDYALTYTRYSDTDVYVQFGYFQYHQGFAYERRYDCHYVGNDSSNGGVYYSFIYVRNVAGTEVIYG